MTEIFCDSASPNNPGTGTSSDPYRALSSAVSDIDSTASTALVPVTVHLTGTFRESMEINNATQVSLTIQQWVGQSKPVIRADVLVTDWDDAASPDASYEASLAAAPSSVVWNWDANTGGTGGLEHFGHLIEGTFDSLSLGEWAHSGSTLQVRLPAEAPGGAGDHDPDLETSIGACLENASGILIAAGNDCHIKNVDVYLFVGAGEYNIDMSGDEGNDCMVEGCTVIDSGFHSIGFHLTTGDRCQTINCTSIGCRETAGSHYVHYSDEDCTGGRYHNCTAYLGGVNTVNVTTVLTAGDETGGNGAKGFFTHTNVGTATMSDLEYHNCVVNGKSSSFAIAFGGASKTADATGTDPSTFPIRFYDCTGNDLGRAISANGSITGNSCDMAFFRCYFEGDMDYIAGPGTFITIANIDSKVYLECCEIVCDTGSADNRQVVNLTGADTGAAFTCAGCSVWWTNDTAGTHVFLRWGSGVAGQLTMQGSVFQSAGSDDHFLNLADTSTASGLHAVADCWYDGILEAHGTLGYSQNTSFNTRTEWTSVIDSTGIYDIDPGWTSVTDLSPTSTSPLRSRRAWTTIRPFKGINGIRYNGYYGAYQYQSPRGRKRNRLR